MRTEEVVEKAAPEEGRAHERDDLGGLEPRPRERGVEPVEGAEPPPRQALPQRAAEVPHQQRVEQRSQVDLQGSARGLLGGVGAGRGAGRTWA